MFVGLLKHPKASLDDDWLPTFPGIVDVKQREQFGA